MVCDVTNYSEEDFEKAQHEVKSKKLPLRQGEEN